MERTAEPAVPDGKIGAAAKPEVPEGKDGAAAKTALRVGACEAADFGLFGTHKTPIEKTELRGTTLPQLEQLDDFIERHADEDGVLRGWLDREGQPLHKDRVNLYDVVKYVVKPATEKQPCSYVELVAPAGTSSQRPK